MLVQVQRQQEQAERDKVAREERERRDAARREQRAKEDAERRAREKEEARCRIQRCRCRADPNDRRERRDLRA